MTTMVAAVHEYTKKKGIEYVSEEYVHTYKDGSQQLFYIETVEKEKDLFIDGDWYPSLVPTKRVNVTIRGLFLSSVDWFDGRTFNSVSSAIKAIQKDLKNV